MVTLRDCPGCREGSRCWSVGSGSGLLDVAIGARHLDSPALLDVRDTLYPAERFDLLGVYGAGKDPEVLHLLLDLHPDALDVLDDLGESIQVIVVDRDQQAHLRHFFTFFVSGRNAACRDDADSSNAPVNWSCK